MVVVVVLVVLLETGVREMHEHVLGVVDVILLGAEAREAPAGLSDLHWAVVGHQVVHAQIELLIPDKQRVVDVLAHNEVFLVERIGAIAEEQVAQLLDLRDFVDQKNTLALALSGWFHDPLLRGVPLVVVHKDGVVLGQDECLRNYFLWD